MDARTWARLTAPIFRRLRQIVTRGIVRLVDPAKLLQSLQVEAFAGETLDRVEHFEPYGFTSHPLTGAEVLLFSLSGRRSHNVAGIVTDRRYRKKNLAPGEVAFFTDEGDVIHFKRGRLIEITAGTKVKVTAPEVEVVASTKVTVTSPLVEMSGALNVAGAIVSATLVADPNGTMQEMRSTYNGHTHPENNQQGGNTNAPNQPMS